MVSKAMTGNSFTYKGEITFRFKRNNKIYNVASHNTGTQLLLDTITRALANLDISNYLPKFLQFKGYRSNGAEIDLLSHAVPFTGISYGEVARAGVPDLTGGVLLLNAIITPQEKGRTALVENITRYRLCLQTPDKDDLAYIEDNALKDVYVALNEGSEVIIEWRMIFENK